MDIQRNIRRCLRALRHGPQWGRCVSSIVLLTQLWVGLGIPLPVSWFARQSPADSASPANIALSKSGEKFPCATSACGCRSAEACWRSCCCTTLTERLAWARRHGVTPPEFVLSTLKKANSPNPGRADVKLSCSSGTAVSAACCDRSHSTAAVTPADTASLPNGANPSDSPDQSWVVMIQAWGCQGLDASLLIFVPSLISVDWSWVMAPPAPADWLGCPESDAFCTASSLPPVPPPELA